MPKERFELSRARCPLRPERSASASSATSASELLFYRKGRICQIKTSANQHNSQYGKNKDLGWEGNVDKFVNIEPNIWSSNVQKWRTGSYPEGT